MRSSSLIVWVILSLIYVTHGCKDVMKCHDQDLNDKVNIQISTELKGHYTYLYLSQIFDQHTRHYPKVAKYLRAKAAEELGHAERFIEYQNQRGGTVEMGSLSRYVENSCADVQNITAAFKCAIDLETFVTRQLTQLHQEVSNIRSDQSSGCGAVNDKDLWLSQPLLATCKLSQDGSAVGDYVTTAHWEKCHCSHISSVAYVELADMITHEFLDHQIEDTKEIASHYRSLLRLQSADGEPGLGDYLFDKHLDL